VKVSLELTPIDSVTLSDGHYQENACSPALLVGNLVAEAAARCRAEPDIV
jgi:hypothetical protein